MLSVPVVFQSTLAVTINIPSAAEYKAKLEDEFKQFTDYYATLFAVIALVFIVKGIVS